MGERSEVGVGGVRVWVRGVRVGVGGVRVWVGGVRVGVGRSKGVVGDKDGVKEGLVLPSGRVESLI